MQPETPPVRKPQTPAQLEALERGRATQAANRAAGITPPRKPPSRARGQKRKPAPKPAQPRLQVEKPPSRPAAPVLTARERDSVKDGLNLILSLTEGSAATFLKTYWTEEDRLSSEEQSLLVSGIYAELECWPKVLRALASFTVVTSAHIYLGICIQAVAAPRLARRGIINEQLAAQLQALPTIVAMAAAGQNAVSMATEPTPGSGGPERDWQEHANGNAVGLVPPVPGHLQEQVR